MSASFSTSDAQTQPGAKPVRVPILKHSVFEEARDLASALAGWKLVSADERTLTIVCERAGGLLSPRATVTISVTGPDGLPSAEVNCRSESAGGLLSRDRRNVREFMLPFERRVC